MKSFASAILSVAILSCVVLVAAGGLTGCASVAKGLSSFAGTLSGPASGQATTLADAVQLADLATKATKIAVDSVKLPKATLIQLSALNDGVHAAVTDLETANANGQSLNFAAFNAALSAWNAYAVANGVGKTG